MRRKTDLAWLALIAVAIALATRGVPQVAMAFTSPVSPLPTPLPVTAMPTSEFHLLRPPKAPMPELEATPTPSVCETGWQVEPWMGRYELWTDGVSYCVGAAVQ